MGATLRLASSRPARMPESQTLAHAGPLTPALATVCSSCPVNVVLAGGSSGSEIDRSSVPPDPRHTSADDSPSVLRSDSVICRRSSSRGMARESLLPKFRMTSSGAWRSP